MFLRLRTGMLDDSFDSRSSVTHTALRKMLNLDDLTVATVTFSWAFLNWSTLSADWNSPLLAPQQLSLQFEASVASEILNPNARSAKPTSELQLRANSNLGFPRLVPESSINLFSGNLQFILKLYDGN